MARFLLTPAWLVPITVGDPQATLLNLGCSQYNATTAATFIAGSPPSTPHSPTSAPTSPLATEPRAASPSFAMAQCHPYVIVGGYVACFDAAAARLRAANGGRAILDGCVLRYEGSLLRSDHAPGKHAALQRLRHARRRLRRRGAGAGRRPRAQCLKVATGTSMAAHQSGFSLGLEAI
ncbi:uncharacterized protein LOC133906901 [Phragmites australis]|uniref:uncharacterized protein LOC133906901 n=1 Tax=Phragmites australis TaxID=29695 RepID=UPI002D7741D0|nr:uncharacterized protein LOC133906901 [Phragmites australis]